MAKIESEKWYRPQQIKKLGRDGYFPYQSDLYVYGIINQKLVESINIGTEESPRYKVKGKELLKFNESPQKPDMSQYQ